MKKLRWYVNQGLADQVCEDPPTIRLRFEPSGRRGLDDPLLLDGKPNVCVVCGCTENLTRHHIIPYCFIKYMALEYKVDIIRDIFPLCRPCHNDYEAKSYEKRLKMADDMGVCVHGIANDEIRKVRHAMGAASALVHHKDKMPTERREELFQIVRDFIGKQEITDEDLNLVKRYKIKDREDYVNFSKFVAHGVADYNEFAKEWRTHFVDTMQPKYMPDKWKIDRLTQNVWVPARMLKQRDQ
jgi:hypothetical protein